MNKKIGVHNKEGQLFDLRVNVPKDPNTTPTYSYKFPSMVGTKLVEKWACKVRPPKDLTRYLSGCNLKRYKDYIVEYNQQSQNYEYWFQDPHYQLMFSLAVAGMKQSTTSKGYPFKIVCPCCNTTIKNEEIEWSL